MARLPTVLGLFAWVFAFSAQAEIAVIVNAANPVHALTMRQVAELYLGRVRTFENSQLAVIVDQDHDEQLRSQFFKGISGMSPGQVTAYWARLKFTGQVQPPRVMDGDAAVLNFVRRNPSAIGYVSLQNAADSKVKTVLVLKE